MKITMTEDARRVITMDRLQAVETIKNAMKEQKNLNDEAEILISVAAGNRCPEILKISAEFALNRRIWNYYSDSSADVDIWMKIYAFDPCYGFYQIEGYLSDAYSVTGDNREAIRQNMYIRRYTDTNTIE